MKRALQEVLQDKKLTARDFAHLEANREYKDRERREDPEFEEWEKMLLPVIKSFLLKRDHPESAEAKERRLVILFMAGGMKCASVAGQGVGLEKLGLSKVADAVVGTSGGAFAASYLVAGHMDRGLKVFYDQCCDGKFVRFSRVHRVLDVGKIRGIAADEGPDKLNQEAMLESKTDLFVIATNQETGEAEVINAKTAKPGPIDAITASAALPLLYRIAIEVNGKQWIDGGFDPIPLQKIIKETNPTDLLILPSVPFQRLDALKMGKFKWVLAELVGKIGAMGIGTAVTIRKTMMMREELRRDLEEAKKETGVNIAVLWPPDTGLWTASQDPDQVRNAGAEAALDVIRRFGGNEKTFKDLNLPKRTVLPD